MTRFNRRTALGMGLAAGVGVSLHSLAMGQLSENHGSIFFVELDSLIESPEFFLSKSGILYDSIGQTTDGEWYSGIVWQQRIDQTAGYVRILGHESDDSIIILDTADEDGVYGNLVEAFLSSTAQLQKLRIIPQGKKANSHAICRSVARALDNPDTPVHRLKKVSIIVELTKASFDFA